MILVLKCGMGEVLSLGVLPEFQTMVPPGGQSRVTTRLAETVMEYFRGEGFKAFYLLVQPHNIASNLFCSSLGCEFDKVFHAGLVTHRYTYYLNQSSVVNEPKTLS